MKNVDDCTTGTYMITAFNIYSTLPYMSQKRRREIFCLIIAKVICLRRSSSEIAKKTSWHLFGGHLGPLAAQNLK